MDIALVIFWLFALVSIFYVVHFGVHLVDANFYDVWQQRRKRLAGVRLPMEYEAEPAATATRTRRALPEVPGLVSIASAAHNEKAAIVRTLDSVRRTGAPSPATSLPPSCSSSTLAASKANRPRRLSSSCNARDQHIRRFSPAPSATRKERRVS